MEKEMLRIWGPYFILDQNHIEQLAGYGLITQ